MGLLGYLPMTGEQVSVANCDSEEQKIAACGSSYTKIAAHL
jgi:hypothetical protein